MAVRLRPTNINLYSCQHNTTQTQHQQEGFTHATGNTKLLLTIANAFYKTAPGEFVLLTIETARLKSEVKLEQADAPLPGSESKDPPRCPHIFGPIELDAVVKVSAIRRSEEDGTFLSMEGVVGAE